MGLKRDSAVQTPHVTPKSWWSGPLRVTSTCAAARRSFGNAGDRRRRSDLGCNRRTHPARQALRR